MSEYPSGIRVFVEVAKAGSFTLAAERLGLSKSAVSKTISRLEGRLGDHLFTRSTRSLALTVSGEAYLESCTAALDILKDAEENLGGQPSRPSGRLRLDMPIAFGRKIIVPALSRICTENPELELTLSFSDHHIDPIEQGVDLVIRFGQSPDNLGLVSRTILEQAIVICASPEYLRAAGTPKSLRDIPTHRCIVGYRRGAAGRWAVCEDGTDRPFDPPPTYQVSDGIAIIDMAEAGLGLCQMPIGLVREQLTKGTLVTVLDDYRGKDVSVQLVWPGGRKASPRVRFLIDRLVELGRAGHLC